MKFKDKNPVLVIVDMQRGYDDQAYWGGNRNNPNLEKKLAKLLELWREKELPVVHVKHKSTNKKSPLHKQNEGCKLKPGFNPVGDEPLFKKKVNGAFIGTKLEQYLIEHEYQTVVFAGLTTNHCISTSARMGYNLGFNTFVLSDCTATFDRVGPDGVAYEASFVHQISLANLHGEFATVITSEKVKSMVNSLKENE